MSGDELKALCAALCAAFDPQSFDRMVRFGTNKPRYLIAPTANFAEVIFQVVSAAEREGWVASLIRWSSEANPGNPILKAFCSAHPHLIQEELVPDDLLSITQGAGSTGDGDAADRLSKQALRDRALSLSRRLRQPAADARNYYYFYVSLDKLRRLGERVDTPIAVEPTISEVIPFAKEKGPSEDYRARCRVVKQLLARLTSEDHVQHLNHRTLAEVTPGWGYAEIELTVAESHGEQLLLKGKLPIAELQFSCSKRFFFDFDPSKEEVSITSTNHWFFVGHAGYRFLTHFLILSVDPEKAVILASPVYLALPSGILD